MMQNDFTFWTGGMLGATDPQQAAAVLKSITAVAPTPNTASGAGAAIQVESLEPYLKNASYSDDDLMLLRLMLNKGMFATANAIVHQWSNINKTYDPLLPAAVGNTDKAPELSADIVRYYTQIKMLNAVGSYEFAIDAVGNVIRPEGAPEGWRAGDTERMLVAMRLAGALTRDLYWGDSTISANEFDGVWKIVADADAAFDTAGLQVRDLRGKPLSADFVSAVSTEVSEQVFGEHDSLLCAPTIADSLKREAQAMQRIPGGNGTNILLGGNPVRGILAATGSTIVPYADKFLSNNHFRVPSAESSTSAPDAPTIDTAAQASDAASRFDATYAGAHYYKIVAVGPAGYSSATTSAQYTIAVGEKNTITLTDSGVSGVTYYHVWRTVNPGDAASTVKYLGRTKKAAAGNTSIVDLNADIPGTSRAFMLKADPTHFAFAQYRAGQVGPTSAPAQIPGGGVTMNAVNFGLTNYSQQFGMFLFGAPFARLNRRLVMFKNVGTLASPQLV